MAREAELLRRVKRLLNGEFRTEDFTRLFLWLRDRRSSGPAVQEIGDFVAHSGERKKGPVTEDLKSFFLVWNFVNTNLGKKIVHDDLPADAPTVLRINLARMGDKFLRKQIGVRQKQIRPILEAAISKYHLKIDGRYELSQELTEQEKSVVNFFIRNIVFKEPFNEADLWAQFCSVLEQEKLLQSGDRCKLTAIKPLLMMYAIWSMHMVQIVIDGYPPTLLTGDIDPSGIIIVGAQTPPVGRGIRAYFPIFTTTLVGKDWCDDELFACPDRGWPYPVDISERGKLVRFSP